MEIKNEQVPAEELQQRIHKLQQGMKKKELDAAIIIQRADMYYFSGTGQNGYLFVPAEGEPQLLVRKNINRAREESMLDRVDPLDKRNRLPELVHQALPSGGKLGMELDVLPAKQYFRYREMFSPLEVDDVSSVIRKIRAVKSPWELKRQAEAAAMGDAMGWHARDIIREGLTEIELAAELEAFVRRRGHQGAVRMRGFNQELFYGHILAGENAARPSFFDGPTGGSGLSTSYPQGAGTGVIHKNEPVLVDFVFLYQGYMVDQTRIFCLGRLPEQLEKAYQTSLEIKRKLADMGRAGVPASDLFKKAGEMAEASGLSENFLGAQEKINFVGHGVGLELDEFPVIAPGMDTPLVEGNVFALEPKFIFPGMGTVGVEDTFVVRSSCLEQITTFDDSLQYL